MNREELINDALVALSWEKIGPGRYQERFGETDAELRRAAADVVDAILPQVSTVEEVRALPTCTLLSGSSQVFTISGYLHFFRDVHRGLDYRIADVLADGPLTVVWRPES